MGFDYSKLDELKRTLKEAQFVSPDEMAGGGAGAPPTGDPAAAGAAPMDPSMMAGGGMPPVDPSMMGGMPPVDPSMMAGDPAAAAGGGDPGDVSPNGEPYMKITPTQLSKLFKQFAEVFKSVLGIGGQPGQAVAQATQPPAQDPAVLQKLNDLDAKFNAALGLGG